MSRISRQIAISLLVAWPAVAAAAEPAVSFRNDVMAVLSKAGCNAGACHGNKSGKGGFKLSLRGQDPDADYDVLTRDLMARRTNPLDPEQSLMLLKPSTQLSHEGGLRLRPGSMEYEIVKTWIKQGTPVDSPSAPTLAKLDISPGEKLLNDPEREVHIQATAVFSDGSRRDVSRLAVYEQANPMATISPDGVVRADRTGETTVIVRYLNLQQPVRLMFVPERPGFAWDGPSPSNYIDEHVLAKLRAMKTNPSKPCSDAEFLRRAYLDLLGVLPTPEEARTFFADTRSDKRPRLVDALLERPEYADTWAMRWADLLRLEERALDRKGAQAFHRWIRQSFAENKPLDRFARELISARGSTYETPPANYYRANRDAVTRAESTAQVFLGTRLMCAQCHNHPFDRWTQDDYYSWAAVFGRINYKVLENLRRDTNDGHEFIGEQIVFVSDEGSVKDPRNGKPARAQFLGGAATDATTLDDLAEWMTRPANAYFARSQVNRIWYYLMGRGIVDPIDDFRATNPPTHPALLDALTADFVAHGFDVKDLTRLIMNSRAYAFSADPNETNADDGVNYSHVLPRRLTAEQVLDAQHQAMGVPAKFSGWPEGTRAGQMPAVSVARRQKPSDGEKFLAVFGKPPRLLACECERSTDATMQQAFQMITGPEVSGLIAHRDNRLTRLLASGRSNEQVIEELYLATVTRLPSRDELDRMTSHVERAKDRRQGLEDVAWALLNSKEFVLRK